MSAMKTLQRGKDANEADDVVLIDVDPEHFDSVIIIDVPESLPMKWRGSSMVRTKKKWPSRTVICIDDDENTYNNHSGLGVNENGSFSSGASASKVSSPASKNFKSSAVSASKECQFDQENVLPVRFSKCKCTYSGKASTSNRYGLNTDSESELSDNEHSDSELMEDSSGSLQQQWEEAFSRRMKDIHNDQSGIRDHDSASSVLNDDHHQNDRTESKNGQYKDPQYCSGTGKASHGNEAPSPFITEENTHFDRPTVAFQDDEGTEMNSFHGKPSLVEEEASTCKHPNSYEMDGDNVRSSLTDKEKKLQYTFAGNVKEEKHLEPCEPLPTSNVNKENLVSNKSSFVNFPSPSEQVNVGVSPFGDRVGPVPEEVAFFKDSSLGSGDDIDNCYHQESSEPDSETPSFCNVLEDNSFVETLETLVESVSKSMHKDEDDKKHIQNGGTALGVENCIINEREKLKETDEYKRALEVEWASRQQALKIQAEEAQRLRQSCKRKKAESMRLQDMEKRQKQRVKEVRETQRKDVDNLNLKEVMRSQVRTELKKLEMTCRNMASLLHSLGIQVGSWPRPSANEVQSAYKRALLKFHPDRASQSDIRQQVEAEEKFKLINRLKEKLLPSS